MVISTIHIYLLHTRYLIDSKQVSEEILEFFRLFHMNDGIQEFDGSWILLDKKLVIDYLGWNKGKYNKRALGDFIRMIKEKPDVRNYLRELKKDDPILTNWSETFRTDQRKPHNKKYYAITGYGLKLVAMSLNTKKGVAVARYFIEIEKIFSRLIREKHVAHLQAIEAKAEQLESKTKQLESRNKMLEMNIETITDNLKKTEKQGSIYIISNKYYMAQNIVKIGRTNNMKGRLSTINTSHPGDPFIAIDEFEVYNPILLEKTIHDLLSCYRCKTKCIKDPDKSDKKSLKEFFLIRPKKYKYLRALVQKIVENEGQNTDEYNIFVDMLKTEPDADEPEDVEVYILNRITDKTPKPKLIEHAVDEGKEGKEEDSGDTYQDTHEVTHADIELTSLEEQELARSIKRITKRLNYSIDAIKKNLNDEANDIIRTLKRKLVASFKRRRLSEIGEDKVDFYLSRVTGHKI